MTAASQLLLDIDELVCGFAAIIITVRRGAGNRTAQCLSHPVCGDDEIKRRQNMIWFRILNGTAAVRRRQRILRQDVGYR